METLIGKVNGNLCSLQFYDQGTVKEDGSIQPSNLMLPEKNFHYIKISQADHKTTSFSGFTELSALDPRDIERDIEEIIFDDGFKCIELNPGTVFDSVGVIIRKITFPSTLESFKSELKKFKKKGSGGNGKSLLSELDFSKCKCLTFNSNFLNYWKVKKVNLYRTGCSVSPVPVFESGSVYHLDFLDLLVLPERSEVRGNSFFSINTESGPNLKDYCTVVANTIVVNPALDCFTSPDFSVFSCCNISNFYIKSISIVSTAVASGFNLFKNCRIVNLYITEEIVDEFFNLNFRFDNTTVASLYIFRTGSGPKPANWLNNFKQVLGLSNLITEKYITDVTYDEAVKEFID